MHLYPPPQGGSSHTQTSLQAKQESEGMKEEKMRLKPASAPTKPRTPTSVLVVTSDNHVLLLQVQFPRATEPQQRDPNEAHLSKDLLRNCFVKLVFWCVSKEKQNRKGPGPSEIKDVESQTKPWSRGNIPGHGMRKPQVWGDRTKARQTPDIN